MQWCDEIEIDKLHQKAILRIIDLSQNLFSKSLDETSEKLLLKKLLSKLTTQDFIPIGDELIFGKIFNNIGCNNLFNNVLLSSDPYNWAAITFHKLLRGTIFIN